MEWRNNHNTLYVKCCIGKYFCGINPNLQEIIDMHHLPITKPDGKMAIRNFNLCETLPPLHKSTLSYSYIRKNIGIIEKLSLDEVTV